ncbi:MAG: TetR family transcriptional regulator [Ahrensia sp.]|nr:TetR family transcriptional regulator [Ahrensia sp.]
MSSDTRSRILEAAWKLLEDGAGSEVRMSDIAKKAGISRQAVYLHFPKRADLLIAVTRYIDEANEVDVRLAASRGAATGIERLDAYIEAWGNYIPEIYGVGKALMAMQETDSEARMAWEGRMLAVREGCEAAVGALARDRALSPEIGEEKATDLLWTLLSVRNWEQLTLECGWPQDDYIGEMKRTARRALLADT